ncbi:MAG: hypothetical protein AAB554_03935 [Patescibacteria group bacterium]
MKVYALLTTIGHPSPFAHQVVAVTHAGSIAMACRKFRVEPIVKYDRDEIRQRLPLPPKAEDPEFTQVKATDASASEIGHSLPIPRLNSFMNNTGVWVCELPTID